MLTCLSSAVLTRVPRFHVVLPCLQALPKFLADSNYANLADDLHTPLQIAHKTDKSGFAWTADQPEFMANFNLWMPELHDVKRTWLDKFDFASHVKGSTADTLVFVDVGGGIGHQCARLKSAHPEVPGRVVLQDQAHVVPHAMPAEGVEKMAYDFWSEQPLKGKPHALRTFVAATDASQVRASTTCATSCTTTRTTRHSPFFATCCRP